MRISYRSEGFKWKQKEKPRGSDYLRMYLNIFLRTLVGRSTWIREGWLVCLWSLSRGTQKTQWLSGTVVRTHQKLSLQADHHGHRNVSSSSCLIQMSNVKFPHWSCRRKVRNKIWCILQVDHLPELERRIQSEKSEAPRVRSPKWVILGVPWVELKGSVNLDGRKWNLYFY